MAKPEWGAKHRCTSCDKSFYDMLRNPIICPSCGVEHVPEKLLKPGKPAAEAAKPKVKAKAKVVKPVDDDDEDSEESSVSRLLDDDEILAEEDVDLDDDDDDSDLGVVVRSSKDDDL